MEKERASGDWIQPAVRNVTCVTIDSFTPGFRAPVIVRDQYREVPDEVMVGSEQQAGEMQREDRQIDDMKYIYLCTG